MAEFHDYCAVIFWNFERKNNVDYNFEIINSLIDSACKSQDARFYYKPIFILMMSIIECALYDFLCRIKQERYEGINLSKKEKSIIRKKDLPKQLKNYVDICKKHVLLGDPNPNIYDELYKYLEVRNRIHIQNLKQSRPVKELDLWDQSKIKSCGRLLEYIFLFICEKYPRPSNFHDNPDLKSFPTPWNRL